MKIHQLSVFVENLPGHLVAPCRLLAEAGINIVALSLAETQTYGILRLIVRDWQRAQEVLAAGRARVTVTEVLAVQVEDRPGGMLAVLEPLAAAGLNVEYMYAFSTKLSEQAVLVLRFDDPDAALAALQGSPVSFLDQVELFSRLER
jgi:hypothetical protein